MPDLTAAGGLPGHGGIAPSVSGDPCDLGMLDLSAAQILLDEDDFGPQPEDLLMFPEVRDSEAQTDHQPSPVEVPLLPDLQHAGVQTEFRPPRGFTPVEAVGFLLGVHGRRRPSTAAGFLFRTSSLYPASRWWTNVVAAVRRHLATELLIQVDDDVALDSSGLRAFQHARATLFEWVRRPLDDGE